MTISRICGRCSKTLNKENTGELRYNQPNCNTCTHINPTCTHQFSRIFENICYLCGFDKNYKGAFSK